MFELLVYDAKKRIKGSLYLAAGMAALALMVIWIYPSFSTQFEGDELIEAYPDALLGLFDVRTMSSLEGFLAFELYVFGWIIMLGLYFAYSAAGIIADDIDRGLMDSVLALPVSRSRVLVERFAALGVPIVVVNVILIPVLLVSSRVIGEPLAIGDIVAVHLLSIPYLFACAAIGLVFSVLFDRVGIAQRMALAVTFALFLIESLLEGTEFEPVGAMSPMRYYDPNGILLDSNYDLVGTAILLGMIAVLIGASALWFARKDV